MSNAGSENSGHAHADQAGSICFGPYIVDLEKRELRKEGFKLKIPNQSFQILTLLLERPGRVVTRETLKRELWPDDVYVNFEGSLNTAVQKLRSLLNDTSRSPRYIETLPKEGYRFIAEIVVRSAPAPGTSSTPVVLAEPQDAPPEKTPTEVISGLKQQGQPWKYWAVSLRVILAVLVVGLIYRQAHKKSSVKTSTQVPPVVSMLPARHSVAIMGFTNVSGDGHDQWLSTAFSEMLATELGARDDIRTIAAEHVARAKLELAIPSEDSYAPDTLSRIHKDLGCEYVIAGSYLALGQGQNRRVRLDARVQDAVTGDTVANVSVAGSRQDLFELASLAGDQLRAKLGVGKLTTDEASEAKLALPANPEAVRIYSEALAKLRLYDNVGARRLFERVVHLQPDFAPAYAGLANAWFALGYDAEATAAAKKAVDLGHDLPQKVRLKSEARYYEMSGQWAQAIEIYSRLHQTYPDSLDYGLDLVRAQSQIGNNASAAVAIIAALRELPAPERDDPRIDIAEARIADELGEHKREKELADSAAAKAEATGARMLVARAKLIRGYASQFLADFPDALASYDQARRMYAETGNLADSAAATMDTGIVLWNQGDLAGAKRNYEQARDVFRRTGDQASLAATLTNLGQIYQSEDDLPKAEQFTRQGLSIYVKLNKKGRQDIGTLNVAEILSARGRYEEARKILEPLTDHLRGTGNRYLFGLSMEALGLIDEVQGNMKDSKREYEEAVATFKPDDKMNYSGAERSLGRMLLNSGDLEKARAALSEALATDRDTGAKGEANFDEVVTAQLSLAEGTPVDIEALRQARDEIRSKKMKDEEIEADTTLVRSLLRVGRVADADAVLKQARVLTAQSYSPTLHLDVAVATAQLQTDQRRFDEARHTLQEAMEKATACGCVRWQLETRLAASEIEMRAGNAKQGQAQLHQIADEARSRGYGLIATRAISDGLFASNKMN